MKSADNIVTIVHPLILNSSIQSGGIETWIEDYLRFSQGKYVVLGVKNNSKSDARFTTRDGVRLETIARIPVRRKYIPNLVRIAFGLAINRKLLSRHVHAHRLEIAILIKVFSPKSKVALFLHTDLKANLSKKSDSIWRHLPFLYRLVEKIGLASADRILVYSREVKNDFEKRGIKCELGSAWYNDEVFFKEIDSKPRRLLVWVGRFERVKDPDLAVEVFSKLVDEPGIDIRLYGSGSMFEDITKAINSLGLASKIALMGNVSKHELAEALRESKVILQTSHFEGSPRVIVEALACGARIVSTEGGDPEGWSLDTRYGIRVSNRGAVEIAEAIKGQLQNLEIQDNDLVYVHSRAASVVAREIEGAYSFD